MVEGARKKELQAFLEDEKTKTLVQSINAQVGFKKRVDFHPKIWFIRWHHPSSACSIARAGRWKMFFPSLTENALPWLIITFFGWGLWPRLRNRCGRPFLAIHTYSHRRHEPCVLHHECWRASTSTPTSSTLMIIASVST